MLKTILLQLVWCCASKMPRLTGLLCSNTEKEHWGKERKKCQYTFPSDNENLTSQHPCIQFPSILIILLKPLHYKSRQGQAERRSFLKCCCLPLALIMIIFIKLCCFLLRFEQSHARKNYSTLLFPWFFILWSMSTRGG